VWDAWPQREEPFSWRWLEATAEGDSALRHCTLLLKAFADVWVDSLCSAFLYNLRHFLNSGAAVLPRAAPEIVTQFVYVGVALLSLWVVKALLSVIVWAGACTFAVVGLSRWLRFAASTSEDECAPASLLAG